LNKKNANELNDKINEIKNNEELTEKEKSKQIKFLALDKHINIIDPYFKATILLDNLQFDRNNIAYVIDEIVKGKVEYRINIQDLINDTSKIFEKEEIYLTKNISDEMILSQYIYLIENCALLSQNQEKYEEMKNLMIEHLTCTITLHIEAIILQLINIVRLSIALASMNFILIPILVIEILFFIYAIFEFIKNINFDTKFISLISEIIYLNFFELPTHFKKTINLSFEIENNMSLANNNEKYIDNIK
jgi:hypothetical protein